MKGEENFTLVDVPKEKPPLLSGSDAQALQFLKMFADEVHMASKIPRMFDAFGPQLNTFIAVGILLQSFRRKLLQFE